MIGHLQKVGMLPPAVRVVVPSEEEDEEEEDGPASSRFSRQRKPDALRQPLLRD